MVTYKELVESGMTPEQAKKYLLEERKLPSGIQVTLPIEVPERKPTLDEILEAIKKLPPERRPPERAPSRARITPTVEELIKFGLPPARAREIQRLIFEMEPIPEPGKPYFAIPPALFGPPIFQWQWYLTFLDPTKGIRRSDSYTMAREILRLNPKKMVLLVPPRYEEREMAVPSSLGELAKGLEALEVEKERIRIEFDTDRAWVWKSATRTPPVPPFRRPPRAEPKAEVEEEVVEEAEV